MGLALTSADVTRLEAALTTLLSPLESPTLDHWRTAANQSVRDLLGADKAIFIMPSDTHAPFMGEGVDAVALEAYLQHFSAHDVGLKRQRELGLDVWSVFDLLDATSHRKTEIWNDWKAPNSLWGATGLTLEIEGAPAGMICYDPWEDPLLEERQVALLGLVKAAFTAGVRTYYRMAGRRASLTRSLDLLGDAVGLYDLQGHLLHANPALLRLVDAEPRRDGLTEAMRATASFLGLLASRHTKTQESGVPGPWPGEVEAGGRYRVTGTYLGHDLVGPGTTVLVTVTTLRPPMPSEESLRARFRLTRREAAVALLLVQGMSNQQLASRLGISPHTARHHTESVFLKLNVHSRAELTRLVLPLASSD